MIINGLTSEYQAAPLATQSTRPRLAWRLFSSLRGDRQTAYQVQCGSVAGGSDLWDSGKILSPQQNQLAYGGSTLTSRQKVYWQVRAWSAANVPTAWASSTFEVGLILPADWAGAVPIGFQTGNDLRQSGPAAHVRKSFTVTMSVSRARLFATALGLYRPSLNGQRVGTAELTPGWTDYTKRLSYQCYDVTRQINSGAGAAGANVLGLTLGDGWFLGNMSIHTNAGASPANTRNYYGVDTPRGICALWLDYSDGTSGVIISDSSWKGQRGSNLTNDIYNGSSHDSQSAISFTSTSFDASTWASVSAIAALSIPLVAQSAPPITRQSLRACRRVTSPSAGTFLYDFGQNFAGWTRLKTSGLPFGTTIRVRHGEDLKPDGTLYTANLRAAAQTDTYTLGRGASDIQEPLFTSHGFRYAELTGWSSAYGTPPLDALTGVVVHADTPAAGDFACSDATLTQIWRNFTWAQRSNFHSVPSDCPQRDERMGWTADAHITARASAYARDMSGFYTKWCQDLIDSQDGTGGFGDVVPFVSVVGRGSAGWHEAGVIVPWLMYQVYGDVGVLVSSYASMRTSVLTKGIAANTYGDYLNLGQGTDASVFTTAFAYYAASLFQQTAVLLGNTADATAASAVMSTYASSFAGFVNASGVVQGNSQTGYVLALRFGLVPAALVAPAFANLLALYQSQGLKMGFAGVAYFLDVLTSQGRPDVAYGLLQASTNPGWAYGIAHGATTTWERWDAPSQQGTGDNANSYNHPVEGCVAEWLMKSVAGIDLDPLAPGFSGVILRPQIFSPQSPGPSLAGGVSWARGEYQSIRGRIVSAWSVPPAGGLTWTVQIPVGITASAYLPCLPGTVVLEGGQPAASQPGVTDLGYSGGARGLALASGDYRFTTAPALPKTSHVRLRH